MNINKDMISALLDIDLKIKKLQLSCGEQDLGEVASISEDFTEFWKLVFPEELVNKCCEGGPQWGHAWNCKTLP